MALAAAVDDAMSDAGAMTVDATFARALSAARSGRHD
jgi:hypothetical protein